jgi:hypothetical protein
MPEEAAIATLDDALDDALDGAYRRRMFCGSISGALDGGDHSPHMLLVPAHTLNSYTVPGRSPLTMAVVMSAVAGIEESARGSAAATALP